jgi:hypothetical protein
MQVTRSSGQEEASKLKSPPSCHLTSLFQPQLQHANFHKSSTSPLSLNHLYKWIAHLQDGQNFVMS